MSRMTLHPLFRRGVLLGFCLAPVAGSLAGRAQELEDSVTSVRALRTGPGSGDVAAVEEDAKASPSRDWQAQVLAGIQAAEYTYSETERGVFSAPNRSQDLRSRFDEAGLEVVSRTKGGADQAGGFTLGMSLERWGAPGELVPVGAPHVAARGNRIDLARAEIVEWYVNSPRGLEQGFDVPAPPTGVDGGRGLLLELSLRGSLLAELGDDRRSIEFRSAGGALVLRYAGLVVWDAGERPLDADLALEGDRLRIRIDDRGARYPVTVDPLMTSPSWTAESDQTSAFFGFSVASAGDVNGDGFDDVIVGAPLFDNGQFDEGRAFVYHGSATGLATTAGWIAESDQAVASFGWSVASAGDVNGDGFDDVIVGALFFDNGQTDEGRAFVYHGSATGLSLTPAWTAESDQFSAEFGLSVAGAGDVDGDGFDDVIVGAPLFDNGETNEGRAFVYHGSATGLATTPGWTAESDQANAEFGTSVASAGDVNGDGFDDVIVGAYHFDNGQTDEGRAFVYHGSATGLSTTPGWTAESDQAIARFGISVASAGDVDRDGFADVIVGAPVFDNGQADEGRAFVYHGSATGLSATPGWTAESDQIQAWYGSAVACAGDVNGDGVSDVIVGARLFDNGQTNEGRVFVYHGVATGLSTTPNWTAESDQIEAWFGTSVASAGDVNGDGFDDVIVGAPGPDPFDPFGSQEGRAVVYHGSATGISATAGWTAESNQLSAQFGISVAKAGDVDGDGFDDVIVGAPNFDNGQTDEGRAFVYQGSSTGLSTTPGWTAESDQAGALFGTSVASAGDVDGDGFDDVIVGAPLFDNGEDNEGRVYLYHGSATGLSMTAGWTAESNQAAAHFGWSVASAGDVNADNFDDVIVGAQFFDNGQTNEGRAFVYLGSGSGLSTTAGWTAESDQVEARFGTSVAAAGDVDGDGFDDVIVGAPLFDNGQTDEGRAFVYHGSATGLSTTPGWTAESNQSFGRFGNSVASAGDVNGDGFHEVIVGAFNFSNGQSFEGRAFLYHGSAGGLSTTAGWTAESNQAGAEFGWCVAAAGDVNGDGVSDVIVGAPRFSNGQFSEGRAFVYHGQDTTRPVITCPADITQECTESGGAVVAFSVTATDIADPSPTVICVPASGSLFPLGMTPVDCTATDAAGNSSMCSFLVTVEDTTPPDLACPGDLTQECTGPSGAAVNFTVTATDICDSSPTVTCVPSSGSLFPFGATPVDCTATDAAGNSSMCSFLVTVADTTPPDISCPEDLSVPCDGAEGSVVSFTVTATDLCDAAPTVTCVPASGSLFPAGTTTVSCTAEDASSNTSGCAFDVNVGPVITQVVPGTGSEGGDTHINILGCGFTDLADTTVLVGGVAATVVRVTPNSMAFRTPPGVGTADVTVMNSGGAATVAGAHTYVEPAIASRFGNVNVGAGDRENVILINGSAGDAERIVDVGPREEFFVNVQAPSSRTQARYVIYGHVGMPTNDTAAPVGFDLGLIGFPLPSAGGTPLATFNLLGHKPLLGTSDFNSRPAPSELFRRRRGVAGPLTLTLQGLMQDNEARTDTKLSVTNAAILRVQ